jgi:hypothetical protein
MPGEPPFSRGEVSVLSNGDANEDFLNDLLGSTTLSSLSESTLNNSPSRSHRDFFDTDVRVDITLRTQVGQAPLVMLFITVPEKASDPMTPGLNLQRVFVSFEIKLNGCVNVTQVTGMGEPADEETPETSKLYKKLNSVLEISEDLSVLVEYVVGRLRG